jgi:hypothetical protein
MADVIFNISKGLLNYYGGLPATNDALIMVPIETTGLESDATLVDYDNLSVLLAASNNEQTTMGRKTLASNVVTTDDTNNWKSTDVADVTWTAATGNPVSALIVCYDPDTTGGTDADLIPLAKYDFVVTPAGGDVTATINTGGLFRAA